MEEYRTKEGGKNFKKQTLGNPNNIILTFLKVLVVRVFVRMFHEYSMNGFKRYFK